MFVNVGCVTVMVTKLPAARCDLFQTLINLWQLQIRFITQRTPVICNFARLEQKNIRWVTPGHVYEISITADCP